MFDPAIDEAEPPDDRFADLDRRIEDLEARLEGCRQAMVLSRGAMLVGMLVPFIALIVPRFSMSATTLVGSIGAVIGGMVWFGANRSTRDETLAALSSLTAQKARLFDEVAARNGWHDLTPTVH